MPEDRGMNKAHSIFTAGGRDLAYLLVVLATSVVELAVWVTGVSVSASLLVLVIGALVWLATALTFRWAADVDPGRRDTAVARPTLFFPTQNLCAALVGDPLGHSPGCEVHTFSDANPRIYACSAKGRRGTFRL